MNHPELSDAQRNVLSDLDFDTYTDPVAKSVGDWHAAGERWNQQLRDVRWLWNSRARNNADAELARRKARYVQAFGTAATAIVRDSPIEERAVDALDREFRHEERRRLQDLNSWYVSMKPQPSSDEYFRDLTMAFADPEGVTVLGDSDEPIIGRDTAIQLYAQRLDEHEYAILGYNTRVKPAEAPSLLKYGAIAMGAWVLSRALRSRRK